MGRRKQLFTQKDFDELDKIDPSGTLSLVVTIGMIFVFGFFLLFLPTNIPSIVCFSIGGFAIVIAILRLVFRSRKEKKEAEMLLYSGINDVNNLSPIEFEKYISKLYRLRGYKTSTTPGSSDYGIDVLAENESEKIGIQVKKYERTVGVKAVQEVIGGMTYYGCNRGIVITSAGGFSKQAHTLASMNGIELIAYNDLAKLLAETKTACANKKEK